MNMTFYVCITTYQRENGLTPNKIARAINSVINQTYKNWKIVISGDGYRNEAEFNNILSLVPREKLLFSNLNEQYEKNILNLSGQALWCSGGAKATNIGIDIIAADGGSIRCHLDDDDEWLSYHLEMLNIAYTTYSESVFVYTNSFYRDRGGHVRLFPEDNVPKLMQYNNLPPRPEQLIHSSVSWDINKIPLKYRNVIEQGRVFPGDADMWERINKYCIDNNLKTLYIPLTTVFKYDEAEILK